MRAVCLQHVPFEEPGVFARSLEKRGVSLEPHLVPEHGLPHDPGDYLIVMGGPMSVNDPDPWIRHRRAVPRMPGECDEGEPNPSQPDGPNRTSSAATPSMGRPLDPALGRQSRLIR